MSAFALACAVILALAAPDTAGAQSLVPYGVSQDGIALPLAGLTGNPDRGRAIALNTNEGACLLCHAVPDSGQRFMGDVGPSLAGVGARLAPGQLRLRVVDSTRLNPQTVMPAYYRVEGLARVGAAWRDKPVLTAQQVEDVVAWLQGLR